MSWHVIRGHDRVVDDCGTCLSKGGFRTPLCSSARRDRQADVRDRDWLRRFLCEPGPRPISTRAKPAQLSSGQGGDPSRRPRAGAEDKHELPIKVIRELCHDLGLKPMRGTRRVAIIDDADDLNDEASNAFLKTLEEPPPGLS